MNRIMGFTQLDADCKDQLFWTTLISFGSPVSKSAKNNSKMKFHSAILKKMMTPIELNRLFGIP